jgi:hypothetical protein
MERNGKSISGRRHRRYCGLTCFAGRRNGYSRRANQKRNDAKPLVKPGRRRRTKETAQGIRNALGPVLSQAQPATHTLRAPTAKRSATHVQKRFLFPRSPTRQLQRHGERLTGGLQTSYGTLAPRCCVKNSASILPRQFSGTQRSKPRKFTPNNQQRKRSPRLRPLASRYLKAKST